MAIKNLALILFAVSLCSCNSNKKEHSQNLGDRYAGIHVVGAMKNVMWKGELESSINLDTISPKKGLYGLGPESYLTGELLITDGTTYVSKVTSDTTMIVKEASKASAPFFVYANVTNWQEVDIPEEVTTIRDLETLIDDKTEDFKKPFAFKVVGSVLDALIHIQNLPPGTKVSSPEDAHIGQTNYILQDETVEIIGFFSTEHQGVFTHHDSYLHMHLITANKTQMGHLDALTMGEMKLYLPLY